MRKKTTEPPTHAVLLWLGKTYHAATAAFEASTGITAARWRLLFLIHRQGSCTQKLLTRQIRVDPGSITRQIKALEADGLIQREDDPSDNRLTRVTLSPKGEALVANVMVARQEFLEHLLDGLAAADVETCIRVLEHLAVKAGDAQPVP